MNNRPQTLYGIADSPVGLAAWMIDHDIRSYEMIARVFDGKPEGPDAGRHPRQRHALLADEHRDLVGAPLLGHRAVSTGGFFDVRGVKIPVAVSAFPDEIYQAPRSWAEKAYPKLIHYNRLDKGGHFAAWEQPELFTAELRDRVQAAAQVHLRASVETHKLSYFYLGESVMMPRRRDRARIVRRTLT